MLHSRYKRQSVHTNALLELLRILRIFLIYARAANCTGDEESSVRFLLTNVFNFFLNESEISNSFSIIQG